jgi:hypothetical protein
LKKVSFAWEFKLTFPLPKSGGDFFLHEKPALASIRGNNELLTKIRIENFFSFNALFIRRLL